MLNGPRRTGKSTIARAFAWEVGIAAMNFSVVRVLHVGHVMQGEALAEYGLSADCVQMFDQVGIKDSPLPLLNGKTPREVYIAYGNRIREEQGENAVADLWLVAAAKLVATVSPTVIVVPDVRFMPEYNAACKLVGAHNVYLYTLHRPGHTWDGDIGSYLLSVQRNALINDMTPDDVVTQLTFDFYKRDR